jgi:hypothetical protein
MSEILERMLFWKFRDAGAKPYNIVLAVSRIDSGYTLDDQLVKHPSSNT